MSVAVSATDVQSARGRPPANLELVLKTNVQTAGDHQARSPTSRTEVDLDSQQLVESEYSQIPCLDAEGVDDLL